MKNQFLALALCTVAILSTACGDDGGDDKKPEIPASTNYGGKMTVKYALLETATPFEQASVSFVFTKDADGLQSMTMQQIKFADKMPAMTIVIPKLKIEKGENGVTKLVSTVNPIVPVIGGRPYYAFKIENFSAEIPTSANLMVSFNCSNEQVKLPVEGAGVVSLNHNVLFTGKIML